MVKQAGNDVRMTAIIRNSLIGVLGILWLIGANADDIKYRDDLSYMAYNGVWKKMFNKDLDIRINAEEKTINLYIDEAQGRSVILLDDKARKELVAAIEKYNRWNKKASADGVKLEKDIATIKPVWYLYYVGKKWRTFYGNDFQVRFFSQSKKIHQFVFVFPEVSTPSNENISHKIETMYLSYKQANALRKALAPGLIARAIAKGQKQKVIEEGFN